MAEGRTKVYYVSDIVKVFDDTGSNAFAAFVVDVPNNLVAQSNLGWSATVPAGLPPGVKLPKRVRPRHAVGVNSGGKRVKATIATVTSTLWANATGTWTYIDNNGATQTATVTGFVGEAATV